MDRKLMNAAVHEAGHAVFAERVTGYRATVTLVNRSRDGATWWQGHCEHVVAGNAHGARLIALAGPVAEALHDAPHARGFALGREIACRISGTDAQHAGFFTSEELDEVVREVYASMPAIEERARQEVAALMGEGLAPSKATAPASPTALLPQAQPLAQMATRWIGDVYVASKAGRLTAPSMPEALELAHRHGGMVIIDWA